jgi:hypothetical protein
MPHNCGYLNCSAVTQFKQTKYGRDVPMVYQRRDGLYERFTVVFVKVR